MDIHGVPEALQQRLGPEGTAGLLQLLADSRKECAADVINVVGDRFERRLVEETSKLRVEMAQGFATMREEIGALRHEMSTLASALRQEMAAGTSALRQEMGAGISALREEMTGQKFEILKWAFLFWVGQFFAVASLMAILIRLLRAN
jgi:hypothetical protein